MDSLTIERKFEQMGARVEAFKDVRTRERLAQMQRIARNPRAIVHNRDAGIPPRVDVVNKNGKEVFIVDTFDQKIDVQVVDVQPKERHLLLMFKREKGDVSKFLCGHDERHWFVAAIPESAGAKNVRDAMEALKPGAAREALRRNGVKHKNRNKRHNKGFVRQGEWFFLPAPDLMLGKNAITHKNEPISRGRGSKAHICEELYRTGGESVMVHGSHAPNGFTKEQYDAFVKNAKNSWDLRGWERRVRNAEVYVRGYVRHPDHKTIHLDGWHKVEMNLENKARAMQFVAFLD
jgi:hypothetical protein